MREQWWLVLQTSGAKIYWVLAMLLTSVITARYLGPSGRGVFVAALGWVTMFSTLGHLSLGQVIIHIATRSGGEGDAWLPRVMGSALAVMGVVTIAGWSICAGLYVASRGETFQHIPAAVLAIAMLSLPLMMWIENGNGILLAADRLPVMNLAQAVGATATLLFTFCALELLDLELKGALVALVIAQVVIVVISLGYLLRRTPFLRPTRETTRELLSGGMKLHLNAVGTYLFTQANVLILNHYRPPRETAYYQLAVQLMTGLQIIPLAVSAVAYSLVTKLGPDDAWPRQKRLLFQVMALVAGISVVAYFVAPFAIGFVFGRDFLPTVPLFRLLLIGMLGMTLSIVMASQWISRGLFLQAAGVTVAIGALTVIANLLVVPRYGSRGAAWVTVGTYAATMLVNVIMAFWVERVSRARVVV
ncbi:MAG TPA: oligosaccharide flippase family protein [Thermoanaerobaculia bacterium]|nr:oligosaccharide flippase family protein [Thermoanaerobaculia bacterium]